jgi:hypothetical protein
MRQSDDLVRSYTVGKCMMACKFDPDARVPSRAHQPDGDVD